MSSSSPSGPTRALATVPRTSTQLRVGAVNYLNSKPLVHGLNEHASEIDLAFDLPSRLADSLAARHIDVGLVPSIEALRIPGTKTISDACIACRGPVRSVKLIFRVAPHRVKRLALDEGSRTSAALAQILLAQRYDIRPEKIVLPIGEGIETTDADAVLLIGDRAMNLDSVPSFETWDLGEHWTQETGLPFVFAMWLAPKGIAEQPLARVLSSARDRGVLAFAEIAEDEAQALGLTPEDALSYFTDNLHFTLGKEERAGLDLFYKQACQLGIVPPLTSSNLKETNHGSVSRR